MKNKIKFAIAVIVMTFLTFSLAYHISDSLQQLFVVGLAYTTGILYSYYDRLK